MNDKSHLNFVSYAESFLDKHGDNYLGVGWTKRPEDADARYKVMLDVVHPGTHGRVELLDFGCGASHLYEYMLRNDINNISYSGLDISEKFLSLSKGKFPLIKYHHLDILEGEDALPDFDYILMNGIFTSKCDLSFDEMLAYFQKLVLKVFNKARIGIAFNVMSKQVDWERDDLFHLPFDVLASFLTQNLSRHFVIRHDYRLYEYTTYVYKQVDFQ
ncbi:MAG: class I SAM-dependent methyltransferase [Pyrinomonadaceae bacterium]